MKILESPTIPSNFTVTPEPTLLAQAIRVHLANQRQGTQNAKTRAQVNRTRHKLYKQKGTGGARHGDRKAPIFVGGGITFAPKPRDHSLSMSQQMKRKAIAMALFEKQKDKVLHVVSGMDKISGKTAEMAEFLALLEGDSKNLLIVTDLVRQNVFQAARNIPGVTVTPVSQLNVYQAVRADQVIIMEEAIKVAVEPAQKSEAKDKREVEIKTKTKTTKPIRLATKKLKK